MKIAVPTREGRADDHFGHCVYLYKLFDLVSDSLEEVNEYLSR